MPMNTLLGMMAERKASDLFISVGSPVQIKINGVMHLVNQTRLNPQQVEALLRKAINERQWARFQEENELNIGYGLKDVGSFRFSLFRQRGTAAAVIRYIPGDIPAFDTLGLPPILKELILQPRGLFLMVGATGAGKTTTLASLIDYRNAHSTGHILTLEDPIEFVFRNQQSIINQRQIGSDTRDLATALKTALRQAPDCILIGEIRDVEAMSAAIAYAQSGHLVLATLHANNAAHALNRIITFYAPENRNAVLADLATTLRAVVSQRLLRARDGGRVPAVEVMINTNHVAELIETARLTDIPDAINNSMAAGSQSFDRSLIQLLRAGRISKDDALQYSDSPTNLLWLLDNAGDDPAPQSADEGSSELALPDLLQKQADDFSNKRPANARAAAPTRKTLIDFDADPGLLDQQLDDMAAATPAVVGTAPAARPAPAVAPTPQAASNPPGRIFATEAPPAAAKHGTLPASGSAQPAAAPAPAPDGSAAAAQGASFAEFFIKLD